VATGTVALPSSILRSTACRARAGKQKTGRLFDGPGDQGLVFTNATRSKGGIQIKSSELAAMPPIRITEHVHQETNQDQDKNDDASQENIDAV
jgi:hypothetical protein